MQKALDYLDASPSGYHLKEMLSSGASALVFRGESLTRPEQTVVIKVLAAVRLETPEQRDEFLKRGEKLKLLRHPHLLSVIDVRIEELIPYIITAYAGGHILPERLKEREKRLLPLDFALSVLDQAGTALHYLHQQGLTHGNLRLDNVFFDIQGNVLLTDYAQSEIVSEDKSEPGISGNYQAPELQEGAETTPASDQYALGSLAYELLSGQPPFAIISPKISGRLYRTRTLIAPQRHNPALSPQIEQVILKAMAADPKQRYSTIKEFLAELSTQATLIKVANDDTRRAEIAEKETAPIPPVKNTDGRLEALTFKQMTDAKVIAASRNYPGRLNLSRKQALLTSRRQKKGGLPLLVASLLLTLGLAVTLLLTLGPLAGGMLQTVARQMGQSGRSSIGTTNPQPTIGPALTPTLPQTLNPIQPAQVASTPTATKQLKKASPTPMVTATPAITIQPIEACVVKAIKFTQWNTGFTMSVKITNTGNQPINGWQIVWRFNGDQVVTDVWNALGKQTGQVVRLNNAPWNSKIGVDQSTTFGLNVSFRLSDDLPRKFTINGTECLS